ncbi:LamG-like jellyroll fold domain-containing protein [Haliscomenobacter hydrossis]|uniref:Fibronectin type III domain protein n=1 Tax=Haliscomenobacter hydrossis (strain ATCC 27775 / DSM 1100 / LMG 10767 / O) TaxID=760192 RepID=F4KY38_HALH1|nr:LamG-like jellyroll fold domain-containing protein [Haliscomenobacter hydrossis]AEE53663.1 Fibronectin type III domain protein [Haliscomenobacter hydrossis DSM 1100]
MQLKIHALKLLLCGVLSTGALYGQTSVASYPFDGSARDVSANHNDAVVNGAVLSADRFAWANKAFYFDGVQSTLQAPNIVVLNTPKTTVAFWVRVKSLPVQGEVFLLSFGGWQERWKISMPNHGKPVWTTNHTNGISDMDSGDGNTLAVGVWKHVAFVHDGSKDLIYMNGVKVAEKAVVGDLNNTTKPLGIGYNAVDGGNFFNGDIDEFNIFGEALTAEQIGTLYAAQNAVPVVAKGLLSHYSFTGNTRDQGILANHAEGKNLRLRTDRFGSGNAAYRFNGTSSELTAPPTAPLNSPKASISFWVKVNKLPATGEVFLLSHGGWQERWKISLPGHGKPVFTTNYTNGISDMDSGDGNALVPGKWTHVVMVHDSIKDLIYLNGVLANSKNVVGNLNSTQHPLGIGYNPIDGGNFFDGDLDEVQLFNTDLSAAQVNILHILQTTAPVIPSALVAEFKMAGNLHDATAYKNDGINHGSVPSTDRFGLANNAVSFDGAEGIEVANSVAYNSGKTTISFWVNVKELPGSGEYYLLSHGGWQERWKISLPAHGKPVFTTNYANGISDMDSGTPLAVNTWTHVVMVHDSTKDIIYFNGAKVNEKAVLGLLNATKYDLALGYNNIDNGNFFKGSLDEVQLYNEALTALEVANLYNAQKLPATIGGDLVAEYNFNGNGEDATAYHNHANLGKAILDKDRFNKSNKALLLDGKTTEVSASNSTQLNSDYTTVSFWTKINSLPGNGEAFLLSFGGWQERWKISLPPHGKPVWTTNYVGGISDMDSGEGNVLAVGTWTQVAMVHDGTLDKIFINGKLVAFKNVSGKLNKTTKPLGIGYNIIDGGSIVDGSLDDVLIFSKALSDAQVDSLYKAQAVAPVSSDTLAPDAPLNLLAVVTNTTVNLDWRDASDDVGVTAYNLFQDGKKVATTAQSDMVVENLKPLTSFVFGVTALDAAGNESGMTSITVKTGEDATPDTTPPSKPGALKADVGTFTAILSWTASTDDRQVVGYVVLVDGVVVDSLAGTATSIVVSGLESVTPYTFEVYAYDGAGNNSEYADVTATTKPELVTSEPGLVAWYPFEGNANDATPYNNHGAIGGNPVFETVINRLRSGGKALKFDGVQDSVLVPNAVQLISDYTTVSFWIRVDSSNTKDAEAYVLDFGHWDQRWKISLPQHRRIVWTTNSKNTQFPNFISDMDAKDGNELILREWWHVTMVHDGTDDVIYIDGVEVNRKPTAGVLNPTTRPLGIGNNSVEGGQYFIGALDEVKIYNKALTSAEITKLYQNGVTSLKDLQEALGRYIQMAYPNPAIDEVTIKHALPRNQDLLVRVLDLSGRQVGAFNFDKGSLGAGSLNLNIASYPAGTYFANFIFGGKNMGSIKFVKN